MTTCAAIDYPGVKNRLYLVTGATGGIGSACTRLLANLGAKVVLNGRNTEKLQEVHASLPGSGHIIYPGSLESLDFAQMLKDITEQANLPLAGVAHCAGNNRPAPLRGYRPKKLLLELEEYAVATGSLFAAAAGLSRREASCSLVAMSSTSACLAKTANGLYAAARAAVESLCRSFAVEFAAYGIRCNVVRGGFMPGTGMTDHLLQLVGAKFMDHIKERYPLGAGQPEDAANAIVFLLGTASKWITGSIVTVDGGYSIKGM